MQFSKVLHQLKARNFLVKSWFELFCTDEGYYELLMAQIESFAKLVKRNKGISAARAKAYVNFLGIMRNIVVRQSQFKFNKEYKVKLLNKITRQNALISKYWLKQRIEAF